MHQRLSIIAKLKTIIDSQQQEQQAERHENKLEDVSTSPVGEASYCRDNIGENQLQQLCTDAQCQGPFDERYDQLRSSNGWTAIVLIVLALLLTTLLVSLLDRSATSMANVINRLFGGSQQRQQQQQHHNHQQQQQQQQSSLRNTGDLHTIREAPMGDDQNESSHRRKSSGGSAVTSGSSASHSGSSGLSNAATSSDNSSSVDHNTNEPAQGLRKRSLNLSVKSLLTSLVTSLSSAGSNSPTTPTSQSTGPIWKSGNSDRHSTQERRSSSQTGEVATRRISHQDADKPDINVQLRADQSAHQPTLDKVETLKADTIGNDSTKEILRLTKHLLEAIDANELTLYANLCDRQMTSFGPESFGHLVNSPEFQKLGLQKSQHNVPLISKTPIASFHDKSIILDPRVHMLSDDAGLIAYRRLVLCVDPYTGKVQTSQFEETRLWHRKDKINWTCVHLHSSMLSAPSRILNS